MSRHIPRRAVAAVALVSSLTLAMPSPSSAEPASSGRWESRETASALLEQAWSWLTHLWAADAAQPPTDPGSGLDHRCTIDPNGGGCSAEHVKP